MRAKKNFVVVAYDISNDRRRSRVVKILERVGVRVNFSVFECMLTDVQYARLQKEILDEIKKREDTVVYYPICMDCYAKIVYHCGFSRNFEKVSVVDC